MFRALIYRVFGNWGVVALAILGLIFAIWVDWDDFEDAPGISALIEYVTRDSIPRAKGNKFSVAVTNLENDLDRQYQHTIKRLLRDFEGIEVLSIDRTISVDDPNSKEDELEGHRQARDFLKESGTSLIIWGRILRIESESHPDLYITAPGTHFGRSKQYAIESNPTFRLPKIFWEDLSKLLGLVILTRKEAFEREEGRYVADRLKFFIDRIRILVESQTSKNLWESGTYESLNKMLADALLKYGQQSGQNGALEDAIAKYRVIENIYENNARDRAATKNNLGVALSALGERQKAAKNLEAAVTEFNLALKFRTQDQAPTEWAATQNNLGVALTNLGERKKNTQHLDAAVAAFDKALKIRTKTHNPFDWALTKNNLGVALSTLGERANGTKSLNKAVSAFNDALSVRTQEQVPIDWAATQINLGVVYSTLGERKNNPKLLNKAVKAYRKALTEITRQKDPLGWATIQNNLGVALFFIGKSETSLKKLEASVRAFQAALKERTRARVPHHWAITQNNLGNTLSIMGARESGLEHLLKAVNAYDNALKVFKEGQTPYFVNRTKENSAIARWLIVERQQSLAN